MKEKNVKKISRQTFDIITQQLEIIDLKKKLLVEQRQNLFTSFGITKQAFFAYKKKHESQFILHGTEIVG